MFYLKWILSLLYGAVVTLRNRLFDIGFLRQTKFHIPVIVIGNLSAGGTGKTPLTIYLARLLKDEFHTAILSRGYGRKTKGFRLVYANDDAVNTGDEPLMYATTFDNVTVCVCEKRVEGIQHLLKYQHLPDVVLLDDAFQHRFVKPGLSILLTQFGKLFIDDQILPLGYLRESKKGFERADILIITKCPDLSDSDMNKIKSRFNLNSKQQIYFTGLEYTLYKPNDTSVIDFEKTLKGKRVFIFCGIADPFLLKKKVELYCSACELIAFADHYAYNDSDLINISHKFNTFAGNGDAILLTTQKDNMRLRNSQLESFITKWPLYIADVQPTFLGDKKEIFNTQIVDYVRKNKSKC